LAAQRSARQRQRPRARERIYQYGPNRVRDSREFSAALAILAERGRARMQEDGRRRSVAINPALLADWE
jgi:hypothetical protein